jgi:hypothetical protein
MEKNNLSKKIREAGFENLNDFVKANIHYLPKKKQKLFQDIEDFNETSG